MYTSRAPWHLHLGSAFRTMLACSIVGCTTLYGPESVRRLLTFPAFSYVTTILIVPDATLGGALRGCCHVLVASIQAMLPSMLILHLIGPSRFSSGLAAVAVALSSFLIALPGSTHLTTKRIAFGQTVIVYVSAAIQGAQTGVIIQPIHVVASTTLGALASILAMLFPYPHLAYCEEGTLWEKPWLRLFKPERLDPAEKMQEMDMPIRGMELALSTCTSFPVRMMDEELRGVLQIAKKQTALKVEQAMCSVPFDAATAPDTKGEHTDRSSWTRNAISTKHEDLSPFFFLYSMELIQDGPACFVKNDEEEKKQESNQPKKQEKK